MFLRIFPKSDSPASPGSHAFQFHFILLFKFLPLRAFQFHLIIANPFLYPKVSLTFLNVAAVFQLPSDKQSLPHLSIQIINSVAEDCWARTEPCGHHTITDYSLIRM